MLIENFAESYDIPKPQEKKEKSAGKNETPIKKNSK